MVNNYRSVKISCLVVSSLIIKYNAEGNYIHVYVRHTVLK